MYCIYYNIKYLQFNHNHSERNGDYIFLFLRVSMGDFRAVVFAGTLALNGSKEEFILLQTGDNALLFGTHGQIWSSYLIHVEQSYNCTL